MQTYADHVAHEMALDCRGFPHEIVETHSNYGFGFGGQNCGTSKIHQSRVDLWSLLQEICQNL